MHIPRRVFVALFVVFILTFLFTTSIFAAGTTTVHNSTIHTHTNLVRPAMAHHPLLPAWSNPPVECTPANRYYRWTDPVTKEEVECQCDYQWIRSSGQLQLQYLCLWQLVLAQPNPSTWINFNSNMLMDVEGISTSNGARVHQWTSTGGSNQWWGMYSSSSGDGYLNAVSQNSGKCLGVSGGSTAEGASIVQWDCNGNPDQTWLWRWTGYRTSDGWPIWNIVDFNSHMCLGIQGGSTQLGAYAVQWGCNGNLDQDWF